MVHARRPKRASRLSSPCHGFVGRDRELEKISTLLLVPARMITLTGAGGIGKTRLAAEAVGRFCRAGNREARVYWVRLARLAVGSDRVAVAEEIAHAVIEADYSGRSAEEALLDTLTRTDPAARVPRTVLVLDNCEHVLAGVVRLSAHLLDSVPELTILATSREPLGWVDEHLVTVPPLPHRHALTLFRHRAELTGHTVTGADQTTTAAAICRRVNNHPLYIQLAAARLRHQPLAKILHGLTGHTDDARLLWSRDPYGGTESRHRAVTDVIAWSYNLCSDKERLLFDRLSVFAAGYATNPDDVDGDDTLYGGAELDAVETICADDENTPGEDSASCRESGSGVTLHRHEIEHLLERLVDQSLVLVHMTPTTVRYSMLETLRVFAQQRLRERSTGAVDEPSRLARRHRRYYRDKVGYAAANWLGPAEHDLLAWARGAWDNILTAIETSIATPGESAVGLEICTGLLALRLPFFMSSFREIRQWTQRSLHASRELTPEPVELQVEAMALLVWIIICQDEAEDAEVLLEYCVAACLPDTDSRADWRRTAETDTGLPAAVELAWGTELLLARSDPKAVVVLARAREKFHQLGNPGGEAMSRMFEALAAGLLGPPEQAVELSRGNLDRATASGAAWLVSWAQVNWAVALTKSGNPSEGLLFLRRALTYQLSAGDRWTASWAAQLCAWSLAQIINDSITEGNTDRATVVALATEIAYLSGGLRTQRAMLGIRIEKMGPFADESDKSIAVARKILGSEAFTAAEARGSRLRPELSEVQHLALGTLTIDTPSDKVPRSHWHKLTSTERQVAVLAAAGWTNTAIATRRGKSTRTIDAQMSAILQKLAIASRDDIIEHIPKDTIDQVRAETVR
ncbi:helix-turn-helix transcriptional regulator [Nocardia abscessus]|uniref:helix-turn-helix transcriptional regulator n=2 Tax=Nocardia abscessus TaxID=120957 RepID=UPI00313A9AE4